MRFKGISSLIPFLFLLFSLLVAGAALQSAADPLSQISFKDSERALSLTARKEESGQTILFLPTYLSPDDLSVSCPWYISASFSSDTGTRLSIHQIPLDLPVSLNLSTLWGTVHSFPFRIMQCSTNTTVYLETKGDTIEYLNADQNHTGKVSVTFLDGKGDTEYHGTVTMKGRGNSTWLWEKKPYNLNFDSSVSIGPFQDVDQLCLLAEYTDTSKLRNALGHKMGKAIGVAYASDYVFADIFIDGEYTGLYGITTKQEYKKYTDTHGIQAMYELTSTQKGQIYGTDTGKLVRLHYGDENVMLYALEQLEPALQARDWERVHQLIDMESWARKYAMEDLLYNYDMSLTSQYFIVNNEGKIESVLPWDYEYTIYPMLYPFVLAQEPAIAAYRHRSNWYEQLLEDPRFRQEVAYQLQQHFTPDFWAQQDAYLTAQTEEILDSWYCDSIIWHPGTVTSPEESRKILSDYITQFRSDLEGRIPYLLDVCERWDDYRLISVQTSMAEVTDSIKLQIFLPRGTDLALYIPRLLQSENAPNGYTMEGWFLEDGSPIDTLNTLEEDITLTIRYHALPNSEDGDASALPASSPGSSIAVLAAFAVFFLAAFLKECLSILKKGRSRNHARSKVPQ